MVRRKRKYSTRACERAAYQKDVAKIIEAVEGFTALAIDPFYLESAQLFRTTSNADKLKKDYRSGYTCVTRYLLDVKSDVAQLWHFVDDEASAALVRRLEATLETAIRLVDEQPRLFDEAVGAVRSSAPLAPK